MRHVGEMHIDWCALDSEAFAVCANLSNSSNGCLFILVNARMKKRQTKHNTGYVISLYRYQEHLISVIHGWLTSRLSR